MKIYFRWIACPAIGVAAVLLPIMTANPQATSNTQPDRAAVEKQFRNLCAGCHGAEAGGGDRGPALVNSRSLRASSEAQILAKIRDGTPRGMPAFPLPASQLEAMAAWVRSLNASAFDMKPAGEITAGERFFFGKGQCSTCHMVQGRGKANGPDLSAAGRRLTVREIELFLDNPTSQMGTHTTATCPSWAFCPDESWAVVNVRLKSGTTLRGFPRNRGKHDLQLQTLDGRIHLLFDTDYQEISREKTSIMPALEATREERRDLVAYLSTLAGVTPGPIAVEQDPIPTESLQAILKPKPGEWPTYDGDLNGNRHSDLKQINIENIHTLQLQWAYPLTNPGTQTTPIVVDGVMYVTAPGEVCALDSRTGSDIWCYRYSRNPAPTRGRRPPGGQNFAGGDGPFMQPNRGVALLGDRLFYATSDAHLICLNRLTGAPMWEVVMPETPGHYSATAAPLVVGDMVIAGIAGGDGPLRGFLAAYKATTGQQVWRFWTVPKPGEPGSETWSGKAIETGGGATWVTGSYDVGTGTLYWTVGNPFPATDGDDRKGTNLYTNCVLALEAKTGKLRWYYQFTPHDLHDWDATEPLLLVDTKYRGRDRNLMLQANRNGFLYVLDRTNGEVLLGKPFVRKLNWASGIGPDGHPQLLPANQPTEAGVKGCPAVRGATNWYSTAFNPHTRLMYVMAVEDCSIYRKSQRGGYSGYRDTSDPGERYLRAIDIETGNIAWEIQQVGSPESNYSGVLSTAGGLVFYGETGGTFAAVDANTGRTLWRGVDGNASWRASPMTYTVNGRQYVAIASGNNILSFALADK
jgi:PQQ-dependent dehydrogenase (methanol/ethanol family)